MLERFRIPAGDEVRIPESSLRQTVAAILQSRGVLLEDANEAAHVLVTTDLRGVETHGVSNVLPMYLQAYDSGGLNPTPKWIVERETPTTAVIDGDRGLGITQGRRAMMMAIEKARASGSAAVVMHSSGHLGAVGHFAALAAEEDMIGMCMTAAGMSVLPPFGAEPRLGTNPISVAAPTKDEPLFLYDAATSAIADNKVRLASRIGSKLAPGWIANPDGSPILEEHDPPEGRLLQLPAGGTRESGSHKGFGLGLVVEILCTLLSGALPAMLDNSSSYGGNYRHFFAAYDISAFTDVEAFKTTMDHMLQTIKTTIPAPGHERVIYPGLSEYEEEQDRLERGIPLHKEVVRWFDETADELSLPRLVRTAS